MYGATTQFANEPETITKAISFEYPLNPQPQLQQ